MTLQFKYFGVYYQIKRQTLAQFIPALLNEI